MKQADAKEILWRAAQQSPHFEESAAVYASMARPDATLPDDFPEQALEALRSYPELEELLDLTELSISAEKGTGQSSFYELSPGTVELVVAVMALLGTQLDISYKDGVFSFRLRYKPMKVDLLKALIQTLGDALSDAGEALTKLGESL